MTFDRSGDLYAIQLLKSRYFRYLDTKAWDLWRALFTDDLVYFGVEDSALPKATTPESIGGDVFVATVSGFLRKSVTVHHGHMPDIEFQGPDEATGLWAMYDWVDSGEQGFAIQGWGHYHEKYRRESDGNWRIAELRLTRLRTDVVAPTSPGGERPWPPPWTAG